MNSLDGAVQWWHAQCWANMTIALSLALLALAGGGLALARMLRGRTRRMASLGCAAVAIVIVAENAVLCARDSTSLAVEIERVRRVEALVWGGGDEDFNANLRALRDLSENEDRRGRAQPLLRRTWASVLSGDHEFRAEHAFVTQVRNEFIEPLVPRLEARLAEGSQGDSGELRRRLKVYLMLTDAEHVDVDWLGAELTDLNLPTSGHVDEKELAAVLGGYLHLVRRRRASPVAANAALVDSVRADLAASPHALYDTLVERPPGARAVTLHDLLRHEPGMLVLVGRGESSSVDALCAKVGRHHVRQRLRAADAVVAHESWVAPTKRGANETPAGVERDYDRRCTQAWRDWVDSVRFRRPASIEEAIVIYKRLATDDTVRRILGPALTHTTTSTLRASDTRTKAWSTPGVVVPNWPPPLPPGEFFAEFVWFAGADDHRDVRVDWHVVAADKRLPQYEDALDWLRADLERAQAQPAAGPRRETDAALDRAAHRLGAILDPYSSWTRTLLCRRLLDPLLIAGSRLAEEEEEDPGAWCNRGAAWATSEQ